MSAAGTVQTFYEQYGPQGFIGIEIVAENEGSQPADSADAAQIANEHGLTYPVLADPGWIIADMFDHDGDIPNRALIAPGLEAVIIDGTVTPQMIEQYLP
jgi:hypothetical protein